MLADGSTAILPLVLLILAGAVVLLLRRIVAEDHDGNHNIAPELEVAFKASQSSTPRKRGTVAALLSG